MAWPDLPFFLQVIPHLKHLDFNPALALVLQHLRVRVALAVPGRIVDAVWGAALVARLQMRQVSLDVARGAAAARGREADVRGHEVRCLRLGGKG
jgi:hypothetical protein